MATLSCTSSSETSLTFRLSGMTSGVDYGYSRTFYWECDGQSKTTTVSATSTSTSISKTFSGLSPGTTYTCYLEFTDSYGHTYSWDARGTTDSPSPRFAPAPIQTTYNSAEFPAFLYDASPTYSGNMYMRVTLNGVNKGDFLGQWGGSTVVFDAKVTGLSSSTRYSGTLTVLDKNKTDTGLSATVDFVTPARPIPDYTMRIATWLDGNQVDVKSHTQQQTAGMSIGNWLNLFHNNYGLIIPDGDFEKAIVDNDVLHERGLDYNVDLYDDHIIIAYYKTTPTGKAFIYDGSQWKQATAYIYNGSTWVEAEPNIFDGGTWK